MGDAVKVWTKEEVLSRKELKAHALTDVHYLRIEAGWPDNQFWEGGKCYVPVIYKGKPYKCRQQIKASND